MQVFHSRIAAQEIERERQALLEEVGSAAEFRRHHEPADFPCMREQRGIDGNLSVQCFGEGQAVPHWHETDGADDLTVLFDESDEA